MRGCITWDADAALSVKVVSRRARLESAACRLSILVRVAVVVVWVTVEVAVTIVVSVSISVVLVAILVVPDVPFVAISTIETTNRSSCIS